MTHFLCTVCRGELHDNKKGTLVCRNGHCFDISSKGYVNLLSGAKGSVHGDDKQMCISRRDFLNGGYYKPLLDKICDLSEKYFTKSCVLLDAGCGEGYYTSGISNRLDERGVPHSMIAIDISKSAAAMCNRRKKTLENAVCSVYDMPIASESIDGVFSVFSPFAREEFLRVLKPGGIFVMAFPDRLHLFSLKKAIYDRPYENEVDKTDVDGFQTLETVKVKNEFHLKDNGMIKALFGMTPYRYKTTSRGLCRLDNLHELTTSAEFIVAVYKKSQKPL
ncbi:MAG: methyltransferase domain-containing protein [Clostridia bacterium]|nr:methyltransferase domain-containing protein [Clostridia bacterium]